MRFFENRAIASVVLACCICASLIVGGGGALKDLYVQAESTFTASSNSITAEFREMTDNAGVLAGIAEGKGIDTTELWAAVKAAEEAQGPSALAKAQAPLQAAADSLYKALGDASLNSTEQDTARRANADFRSAALRISHDGYNELAAQYNQTRNKFPANIIATLRGVKELELYE